MRFDKPSCRSNNGSVQHRSGDPLPAPASLSQRRLGLVAEIRQKLPLAPFVTAYTGGLKPTGQNFFTGRCPFHQTDREPAAKHKFWVNSAKGICGCFVPACQAQAPGGKPMDVVNFYARLKGISNRQAIEELAKVCGLKQ